MEGGRVGPWPAARCHCLLTIPFGAQVLNEMDPITMLDHLLSAMEETVYIQV